MAGQLRLDLESLVAGACVGGGAPAPETAVLTYRKAALLGRSIAWTTAQLRDILVHNLQHNLKGERFIQNNELFRPGGPQLIGVTPIATAQTLNTHLILVVGHVDHSPLKAGQ